MGAHTWEWLSRREPHEAAPADPSWSLRVSTSGHGSADAVIDGQVVSTPDLMDAGALIAALGGDPIPWHDTVRVSRQVLNLRTEHAPQVPVADVVRALRSLVLPVHQAREQVYASHTRDLTAAWRTVVHSLDPAVTVRAALATRPLPGLTGRIALDHLKGTEEIGVLMSLADQPGMYTDATFAHRAATHLDRRIRARAASHLPWRHPLLRMLSVDPDLVVKAAINRRIDEREAELLAAT